MLSQSAAAKLPGKMIYPAAMFSAGDIKDVSAFAAKLQNDPDAKTRPVSEFLWSRFSTNTVNLLINSPAATTDADKKDLLKTRPPVSPRISTGWFKPICFTMPNVLVE